MSAYNPKTLLVMALQSPQLACDFTLGEWDLLVRQAQSADLLATLWTVFTDAGLVNVVPEQVQVHFASAEILSEAHARSVRWEVEQLTRTLSAKNIPLILLKGAAYQLADLPLARGRMFNDIDILIPWERLDDAEKVLLLGGWVSSHLDEYDQRYYRQWMHELPPLKHIRRRSVLDLHHTILPLTARLKPDSRKLFDAVVALPDKPDIFVLAPLDMVLHSATHLFHEGEFEHGFRGLVDLDGLLRHFSAELPDFWDQLLERAVELDLQPPLYYAVSYSRQLLGTPVPEDLVARMGAGVPCGLRARWMAGLFMRALVPPHPSCQQHLAGLARWLLFVRSHYLKMPLHLLLPHLLKKAMKSDT